MLGDANCEIMTEGDKRNFREKEYKDFEEVEQSKPSDNPCTFQKFMLGLGLSFPVDVSWEIANFL